MAERVLLPTPSRLLLFALFTLLTSGAALDVFSIHSQHFLLLGLVYFASLLLAGGGLLFLPLPRPLGLLLSSRVFCVGLVCLLTAADIARYQVHNHGPGAGTAAPALIEPAREMAHGKDPYLARLTDGAPISPGPGWILLLAPLTLTGAVALVTPVVLLACTWLIAGTHRYAGGAFLCLALAQPAFIAATFGATDLFAIPIFFAVLCLLAARFADSDAALALLGIPAAAFATSRVPMVGLVLVLGIGLYRRRPRAGWVFAATALSLTCLCHALFYLWTQHDGVPYQPLHLFGRAAHAGHGAAYAGAAAAAAVGVRAWPRMRGLSQDWILVGGLLLITAFVPVGAAELALRWDWSHWEGSSYISFGASLLLVALVLPDAKSPRS